MVRENVSCVFNSCKFMCKALMFGAMKPVSLLFDQPTYRLEGQTHKCIYTGPG